MLHKIFICILLLVLLSGCASTNAKLALTDIPDKNNPIAVKESANGKIGKVTAVPDFLSERPNISKAIFFLNEKTGWQPCRSESVCPTCMSDRVCRTDDGGETWRFAGSQNLENLFTLFFINEKLGWGVLDEWNTKRRSNVVIKTIDGGQTWKEVLEVDSPIYSISFIDQKTGVVSARWSPLYTTNDGGKRWKEVSKKEKPYDEFSSVGEGVNYIAFLDEKRAWGYGGGIWFSEDGCITWENVVDVGETTAGGIFNASFIDAKTGFIVGHDSQIWRMIDGKNWEKIEIPETLLGNDKGKFTFYRVSFISSEEGWILVQNTFPGESVEKLIHTKDGGATWEILSNSKEQFYEIKFLSSQIGFALNGKGELLKTNNGGRKWELQSIENK